MSAISRLLFLTGFMGTGKSTVGKKLAYRLGLPFVDLDHEIEQFTSRSIREIFADEGEPVFRKIEQQRLLVFCQSGQAAIVATGGGIVMNPENRRQMREVGLVVNLQADYASIARRLHGDSTRPLLLDKDAEAVQQMLMDRSAAYADADLVIGTVDKTPDEIVSEIIAWLNQ